MALVLQDRVREISASTGTGSITLGGAYTGYRTFDSCVPSGSVVYYCIQNTAPGLEAEWEVGYGTFTSPATLSRTTVYSSSNAGALVPFTGPSQLSVFITQPAEQAVYQETNGDLRLINGVIEVSLDGTSGTTLSNATFQAFGTVNGYIQNNIQNLSGGADASGDFVATNDIGSDADFFADMGINSSGFNSATYPIYTPNSGYFFSTGNGTTVSDLFVGSGDGDVILHAGGFNATHVVATLSGTDQSVSFTSNVSANGTFNANGVSTFGTYVYSAGNTATAANNTVLTTKAYVDGAVSAGLTVHTPVRVESHTNLNATYSNGTGGVGATLTNAGANAAIQIGTVTLSATNRVLVLGQTNQAHNGVYTVTTVGDGSTAWVLTRATDADTYGVADPNKLAKGSYFYVQEGTPGAGESYVCTTEGTITFGTTAITFALFGATAQYTGTAPINVSGQTISLTGTVGATNGGTGANTVTTGDLLYGSASNTWGKLAAGGQHRVLTMGASTPEWNALALNEANAVAGTLGATNGGTGQSTYTLGDLIYSNATNTLAKLPGQTTTTKKYLQQQGDGVNSAAPSWQQIAAADISGLAPSATTDTSNATNITSGTLPTGRLTGSYTGVTGVGTLTAGTWNANTVAVSYGGTGVATLTGLAYGNGTSAFTAATGSQVVAVIGSTAVANATYAVSSNSSTYSSNIIGGLAGGIPYQTGANATSILAAGTGVLVGGATPAYSTTPTLTGTNFSGIPNSATTASASNGASTIVARDVNGSFACNIVTGSVTSLVAGNTYTAAGFTANSATGKIVLGTDAGGSFEVGRVDGVASTPYIDWHSGATAVDYDVRVQASGGNGVSGGGNLTFSGNTINMPAVSATSFASSAGSNFATSSGNVGIGTSSPGAKLDVYNSAAAAVGNEVLRLRYTTATSNATGDINFTNSSGTALNKISSICTSGSTVDLGFSVYNSGITEAMRITAAGNVGIGTSSPTARLHVSTSSSTQAKFNRDGNNALLTIFQGATDSYVSATNAGASLYLATQDTQRMQIDSTGNILVAQAARATITTDNDLSFDMNAASNFQCTPSATGALTFTNITSGQSGYVLLINTGGYAITAAASTKVGSTFLSTVSTAGTYLISYFSTGSAVYCTASGALS